MNLDSALLDILFKSFKKMANEEKAKTVQKSSIVGESKSVSRDPNNIEDLQPSSTLGTPTKKTDPTTPTAKLTTSYSNTTQNKEEKKKSHGCLVSFLIVVALLFILSLCVTIPIVLVFISDSNSSKLQEGTTDDMIAVIDVNGVITSSSQESFFGGSIGASEENLVGLLDDALNDETIDAIILRIESPGGEAVASDIIARKVLSVREIKPVVAYSATTAASGGYMIASAADKFIVHPGVMTGSIGVIMQTTNIDGLYEKLGIKSVTIKSDEFKDTEDLFENPDGEQKDIFQGIVDESYEMFVDLIVEGRDMDRDTVVQLGDGRIYTGTQAVENGLADYTGYFEKAIDVTEELAGLQDATVIEYSNIPTIGELFFGPSMGSFIESRLPAQKYFGVYYLPDLNK